MSKQIIITNFIGSNNLEFVISNTDSKISKILYRSFGNHKEFKEKIFNYIFENKLLNGFNIEKVSQIFQLEILENTKFHFATDIETGRYKFYISLYHHNFKDSLKIITDIKKILGIKSEYFLEDTFTFFDCIGFDIQDGEVEMKIYELLSQDTSGYDIPGYVKNNTKELGVLKDMKIRKKYFYRFKNSLTIHQFSDTFNLSGIEEIHDIIPEYIMQKRVKYYCKQGEREEIYFV